VSYDKSRVEIKHALALTWQSSCVTLGDDAVFHANDFSS